MHVHIPTHLTIVHSHHPVIQSHHHISPYSCTITYAGISAYCVGQLHIPGHDLPWEDPQWSYATNLAHPLDILVEVMMNFYPSIFL